MPKNKMTLEKLAQMVARGFGGTATKEEVSSLKTTVGKIESEMVTKAFLEDKLADLEGNVVLRQRKEDKKVNLIINFLEKRKILQPSEIRALREIRVFPHQI